MKLRNGKQTKLIQEFFFPEDVWNMIKKEYLDIDNYWKKCLLVYKRKTYNFHSDYINHMMHKFSDECAELFSYLPITAYTRHSYYLCQKYGAYCKIYELFLNNMQLFNIKREIDKKLENNRGYERVLNVVKKKSCVLKEEIKSHVVFHCEMENNIYKSKRVQEVLKRLDKKIIETQEMINYYNL